jgi:hypothetical protein
MLKGFNPRWFGKPWNSQSRIESKRNVIESKHNAIGSEQNMLKSEQSGSEQSMKLSSKLRCRNWHVFRPFEFHSRVLLCRMSYPSTGL